MDGAARTLWIEFYNEVEKLQAPGMPFEPIQAFASKLTEHAARLAGVLAVFADPDTPSVRATEMECGIALARHYVSESLRLHDAGNLSPDVLLAKKLLNCIVSKNLEVVTLPLIYQNRPGCIRESATAKRVVKVLVEHNYLVVLPDGAEVVERDGQPVKRRDAWRYVSRDRGAGK